jgi:hypothetical protein
MRRAGDHGRRGIELKGGMNETVVKESTGY